MKKHRQVEGSQTELWGRLGGELYAQLEDTTAVELANLLYAQLWDPLRLELRAKLMEQLWRLP